ncbi:dilute class unconventional myosin isoform X2 [Rhodnius prolixus]|uniref:dilute class unconventional myosin isoform X2 n=1 Tax=Rhodnius prolixus TaxID=13249 RepID=UPI003D18EF5C
MESTLQAYTKGARVWIPHPQKVWESSMITENFIKDKLLVVTEDGLAKELKITTDDDLPPLRNPDILVGENDLTSLSYLHEPAVLHNLQIRFCRNKAIYTYCGIVLVAINPYTDVSIYDPGTIWAYRGQAMGDLDPHVFAVAEKAYTEMERVQNDQSIIVSGESGAGKTVSAKYAMRYFATVSGSSTETQVERKVLASSPIMEAIGNAKTTRNDNSSRFGKYIELQFNRRYTIVGASMSTYLLEKSRVVFQGPYERNYHIFYQICASREKLPNLHLENAESYYYLCNEDPSIPGVDDQQAYAETVDAFTTLGFHKDEINDVFICLASILHLGNITFNVSGDDETCSINKNDKHLSIFTQLLDVDGEELSHWLTNRKMISTREFLNIPMNCDAAIRARDALAKHIYACLFSTIVTTVNRALKTSAEAKHRFIGVLDIYGFETFDSNSFEQFCINYANEKLQQQFNLHVFKLEQEEYVREGIEWTFIDFYDNQSCIDLIESKLGILDLLDEECKMPKGSDTSWAKKLYSNCLKSTHFEKPRFGEHSFLVKHFADIVNYEVDGFLEKNKDTVFEEQVAVLRRSTNKLVHKIFRTTDGDIKLTVPKTKIHLSIQKSTTPTSTAKNKKTVGSQFRDSLNALMTILNSTTPHYIRCIKPNDDKEPFRYNSGRVVQQLRACGVLETIRISAAGFPSRWNYSDFLKRYRVLCKSGDVRWDEKKLTCEKIVSNVIKENDKFKFGYTKIFFRAGQVAYLERLRSERLLDCCIKIQACVRGYLLRCRYKKILKAVHILQKYCRGHLARRLADNLRRNKAAVRIQRYVRGWVKRKQFLRSRRTVLGLQKHGRGLLARRRYEFMRQTKAAIKIQTAVRGWLCRTRYKRSRKQVIVCQTALRGFLARRRFKLMKREARSAEHLKKLNKGLENKIISLQQKLSEMSKEVSFLKGVKHDNEELRQKLIAMKGIEVQSNNWKTEASEKGKKLQEFVQKVEELTETIKEKENRVATTTANLKEVTDENNNLKSTVAQLEEQLASLRKEREEFKETLRVVQSERNELRVAQQRHLAEINNLEDKLELMESVSKDLKSHKRSSSDASTISVQDEDNGYGSVKSSYTARSTRTSTPDQQQESQDNFDWKSEYKKLQEQLKEANRKLVEAGVLEDSAEKISSSELLPVIRKKDREAKGMFEFMAEDIPVILKHLLSLKPKIAIKLLPGLPAYILFMCIRYTDYIQSETMLQNLMMGYGKHMKNVVVKKLIDADIDIGILWLSNTLRLVHNLKQYSGDEHFCKENTDTQNEQCLMSFDLSEFRQMLSDQAIAICQAILKRMCILVQPYAVAAILEHEGISGLTSTPTSGRPSSSTNAQDKKSSGVSALDQLLELLGSFHRSLILHGVDPQLPPQLFVKIFYNLCVHALNNLLLRKEYCHWSKGMQIRYNLFHLEQWAKDQNLCDPRLTDTLKPIMQASQLLQARKSDADVESVAEMCDRLTINQILKLLNLYTPIDSFEENVSETFMANITAYLMEKRKDSSNALMMDINETFALEFPFNPSKIRLEDIEIPEALKLPMLKKI